MTLKKKIKIEKTYWTGWIVVAILHGLLMGGALGELSENMQLKKLTDKAKASSEQRVISLQNELADVRLLSAQLLYNKKSDNLSAVLQTAFDFLEKQQQVLKESYRSVFNMETHVKKSDSIIEPEKKQLLDRLQKIKHQIERSVSIPSLVAKRGGLRKHKCKVLAVNEDLDAVVLDAGFINGISPESKWQIYNSDGETILLQVVEVRRTICAAVSVGMNEFVIKSGQTAEKAKENTLESKENYGN